MGATMIVMCVKLTIDLLYMLLLVFSYYHSVTNCGYQFLHTRKNALPFTLLATKRVTIYLHEFLY